MDEFAALLGLAGVAFVAATILPAQSEAAMVGMQLAGYPPLLLVLFAGAGNTLGAIVNWFLGRAVDSVRDRRWFPVSEQQLDRASRWYRKWGRWSLLLSWAPFVGDALTVAAGVMRERLWVFTLLVGVAKTGRYIVLAMATAGVAP